MTEKRSEIFRFNAFVSASILSSVTFAYAQVTDTKVDEDMKRLRATGFGNRIDLCEEDFTTKKKRNKKSQIV